MLHLRHLRLLFVYWSTGIYANDTSFPIIQPLVFSQQCYPDDQVILTLLGWQNSHESNPCSIAALAISSSDSHSILLLPRWYYEITRVSRTWHAYLTRYNIKNTENVVEIESRTMHIECRSGSRTNDASHKLNIFARCVAASASDYYYSPLDAERANSRTKWKRRYKLSGRNTFTHRKWKQKCIKTMNGAISEI